MIEHDRILAVSNKDCNENNSQFIKNIYHSKMPKHLKCLGFYDAWNGDFDCEYDTILLCEECKYGMGRKDPEAKCNQSD